MENGTAVPSLIPMKLHRLLERLIKKRYGGRKGLMSRLECSEARVSQIMGEAESGMTPKTLMRLMEAFPAIEDRQALFDAYGDTMLKSPLAELGRYPASELDLWELAGTAHVLAGAGHQEEVYRLFRQAWCGLAEAPVTPLLHARIAICHVAACAALDRRGEALPACADAERVAAVVGAPLLLVESIKTTGQTAAFLGRAESLSLAVRKFGEAWTALGRLSRADADRKDQIAGIEPELLRDDAILSMRLVAARATGSVERLAATHRRLLDRIGDYEPGTGRFALAREVSARAYLALGKFDECERDLVAMEASDAFEFQALKSRKFRAQLELAKGSVDLAYRHALAAEALARRQAQIHHGKEIGRTLHACRKRLTVDEQSEIEASVGA